jgi:hypothetical protein
MSILNTRQVIVILYHTLSVDNSQDELMNGLRKHIFTQ